MRPNDGFDKKVVQTRPPFFSTKNGGLFSSNFDLSNCDPTAGDYLGIRKIYFWENDKIFITQPILVCFLEFDVSMEMFVQEDSGF